MSQADNEPKEEMNVGIFVQYMAEVLDFCGPFEVFNNTNIYQKDVKVNVFTISDIEGTVDAQGLKIVPDYHISNHPELDILLIPGGGSTGMIKNEEVLNWIKEVHSKVKKHLLSVCTGSMVYAKAGLLDGLTITSHYSVIDLIKKLAPKATMDHSKRYVDNGRIVTSAGISAGIDMSLYMVERIFGLDVAYNVAKYMEYKWERTDENINLDHLKPLLENN